MLLIIASINFGRLNKIRVKSKMSRNEKKEHGGKHTPPKKWSGARRYGTALSYYIIDDQVGCFS